MGRKAEGITVRFENIVTHNRESYLMQVVGIDPAYIVGYFCDVRGHRVCDTLTKVDRRNVALRIQVNQELQDELARNLTYDNKAREYERAY